LIEESDLVVGDAGVQQGVFAQCQCRGLDHKIIEAGGFRTRLSGFGLELGARRDQCGDVDLVAVRQLRHRVQAVDHVARDGTPHARQRDDLARLRSRHRCRNCRRARCRVGRGHRSSGCRLHISLGDASAGTSSGDLRQIDTQLLGPTTHQWSDELP
jgi:hypothetical protein